MVAAAIYLLVFITYYPAIHGEFIWDDDGHVTTAQLSSLDGLRRIWFELGATQQYYPLLHSAFWVQYHLWGDSATSSPGYHVVNILMHGTAACLFGLVLRRLKIPGATLAAFVFALHPVCVESVAWITELKNTLSTSFYLCAVLAYLRFDEQRKPVHYLIATGLFAAALMSKTVTASLPGAMLVILWWRRGALSIKRDVLPLIPWFVLGAIGGLFTAWVERELIGAKGTPFELSIIQRILLAGRVIWFYLGKLFWPTDLIFVYPRWTIDPHAWWQWLFPIGVVVLLATAWLFRKQTRAPLAALLFFVGSLLPVLGFFNVYPFIFSYVADHFQYLASMGIITLVCGAVATKIPKVPVDRRIFARAGAIVLVMLLAILSWRQSQTYRDIETLYVTTIQRNPQAWLAYQNLAGVLIQEERYDEAKGYLMTALRIKPDLGDAHLNLGTIFQKENRLPEAVDQWQQAIAQDPQSKDAYVNLALLRATTLDPQLRNPTQAVDLAKHAVMLSNETDAQALAVLGAAFAESGQFADAITAAEKAEKLARDAGNDEFAATVQQHLAHYHEMQGNAATKPVTPS